MLERTSLPEQVVKNIRENIESGRFSQTLPSERVLCRQLRVSRNTLRKALAILSNEGDIVSRRGAPTRILRNPRRTEQISQNSKLVVIVSPTRLVDQRPYNILWIDALRSLLHDEGYTMQVYSDERLLRKFSPNVIHQLIDDLKPACWVLIDSGQTMQKIYQEREQPCIISGLTAEGIDIPNVGIDIKALAHYIFREADRKACKALNFYITQGESPGIQALQESIQTLSKSKAFSHIKIDSIVLHVKDTQELCRHVSHIKNNEQKVGLFILNPMLCITAISEALRIGLNPQNLFIATSYLETVIEYVKPRPASFLFDHQLFARKLHSKIRKIINHETPEPASSMIIPKYNPGEY